MNQNQLTMTRGDERTFAFVIDDDYNADTATFVVDGLFEKTATVDEDPGSGYATATFTVDEDDTDSASTIVRCAYPYVVRVDDEGATKTIRRGLFIVQPNLPEIG